MKKPVKDDGIFIHKDQLTLFSVVLSGLLIFAAFNYDTAPASETLNTGTQVQAEEKPLEQQESQVVQLAPAPAEIDLPTLKKEWSPRVVRIMCSDATYISSGTGVLTRVDFSNIGKSDAPTLITNKHVITNPITDYLYAACNFQRPDSSQILNLHMNTALESQFYDVAYFPSSVSNPPPGAQTSMKVCFRNSAEVGDRVAILGYPITGGRGEASRAITLTQGIISSFDGDYYVTDAKIDHGNSGGAAILIKDNCYLGIPTWVEAGGFESLGRILSAENVLVAK